MFPAAIAVHPLTRPDLVRARGPRSDVIASRVGQLTDVFPCQLPQHSSPRHGNTFRQCGARPSKGDKVAWFYWERHPDGPFVTLIRVATTYLDPENYDDDALRALAKREDDEEMRVFKSELRDALKDPGQLPGDELSRHVQYDNGSVEAFLRWLWRDLYGDEHFDADVVTLLKALPEPFAERLDSEADHNIYRAAQAGEWAKAMEMLLAGLVESGAPVSAAERDDLVAMLEAAGRPTEAVAGLAASSARPSGEGACA
jgi:hypothetical protein